MNRLKNLVFLLLKLNIKIEPNAVIIAIKIGNKYNLYKCDLISRLDSPSFL